MYYKTYICNSCFHTQKRYRKAKCESCKSEMFHCDEWIAPTISILNKKGYKTAYCCSGHPVSEGDKRKADYNCEAEFFGTYIVFQNVEDIKLSPSFDFDADDRKVIRWKITYNDKSYNVALEDFSTHVERLFALTKTLIELHNWVEDLPIKPNID